MSESAKSVPFTSPKGIARFPKLVTFDEYLGKRFFAVDLIVGSAEAQPMIDAIQGESLKHFEAIKAAAKTPQARKKLETYRIALPYGPETDRETGEETGNIVFKFKASAFRAGKSKTDPEVPVVIRMFDAFGAPCKADPWGGSVLKVACDLFAYDNPSAEKYGVSLRIKAVQIITLRSAGAGNAAAYGFEAVEDGFSAAAGLTPEEAPPLSKDIALDGNF